MHPRTLVFAIAILSAATLSTAAAQEIDASVVDEGDVGSATQELQGRPNAANGSACGTCTTAGAMTEAPPLGLVGCVFVLGAVVLRRAASRPRRIVR